MTKIPSKFVTWFCKRVVLGKKGTPTNFEIGLHVRKMGLKVDD